MIVAPLFVAKNTWSDEIDKWPQFKSITYSFVLGTEKERINALSKDVDIYITSRDTVQWLLLKKSNFDFIIVDESSSFKNSSTQRFKALKKFTSEYIVLLSGTPAPRSLLDIWSQAYLIDRGERLGKTISSFRNDYFFANPYDKYSLIPISEKTISNRVSDIFLTIDEKLYSDIPSVLSTIVSVELPKRIFNEYKKFERELVCLFDETTVVAVNIAVLQNKLLQYCNGAIYDTDKNIIEIHSEKLDALAGILDDNEGNIIVVYQLKSDLLRIRERFPHAEAMNGSSEQVARWNQKKIKLLLCHPASAGMGLNLQYGGNIIVWFSMTWNLQDYIQMNARLHRSGQEKSVSIIHIIAKNCIDEKILKTLNSKNVTQKQLIQNLIKICT